MNSGNTTDLARHYKELSVKIREYVEAGGDCITWINPGEEAITHDLVVAASASQIIQLLAELRQQTGPDLFQMLFMAAVAMGAGEPAGRSSDPAEWDDFLERLAQPEENKEDV